MHLIPLNIHSSSGILKNLVATIKRTVPSDKKLLEFRIHSKLIVEFSKVKPKLNLSKREEVLSLRCLALA